MHKSSLPECSLTDELGLHSLSWLSLPDEIWCLVLEKLPLVDFVRCRCVCSSWSSILQHLKPSSEPQIPWLILRPRDLGDSTWKFCDIVSDKKYKIDLHELNKMWIRGSLYGWFIVESYGEDAGLRLFNPFTRAQIRLPTPVKALIDDVYMSVSSDNGYIVVVDHGDGGDFWFVRAGDKAWTRIDFEKPRQGLWKATFCKSLFYVLDNEDRVLSFDLSHPDGDNHPRFLDFQVPPPTPPPSGLVEYLVVLPGSEKLLLLQVPLKYDGGKIVKTFRLDHQRTMEVRNIDGHSLFLTHGTWGPPYNIVGDTEAKGLKKGNCVFIADREAQSLNLFDMELQCTTITDKFDDGCLWNDFPAWLTPVLVTL